MDTANTHYTRKSRHPRALVSPFLVNQIHIRNPWVISWWSLAFPGCGHIILCKYFQGFLFIIWEFSINMNAHINSAILYSMTGNFDLAKQTLDMRWFFLYIGVYIYSVWDCYSITIDLNKFYLLADREDSPIIPLVISQFEINYLDNRNAWNAVIWSLVTPGLGHVYSNRLPSGYFLLIWFIVVIYFSHSLEALFYTFTGSFNHAKAILNPQWLLFLPSLYGFACHGAYIDVVETNKLFKTEQSRYLRENYNHPSYKMLITRLKTRA